MDCVFCEKIENETLHRADTAGLAFYFTPLNPVTSGHRLFVPKIHVEDATVRPDVTGYTFGAAAAWGRAQGVPFNLITSAGREATQTVFHLHVHYVPRREGDGLHLPWTGQKKLELDEPEYDYLPDPTKRYARQGG